ncbi:MAG TPA: biopolymer transporter ExbD [Gemmata sp.]|jgi:biopolymer transport protein ExbD|nr:biopolymer transporter ExbD [Gemmata sp.]
MSHGGLEKCEPNFTPLLDLVLQLVMFFMIVSNFVIEQTNVEIKLPEAIAAKALEKGDGDPIFLNVNDQGKVLLAANQREGDTDTLDNEDQVRRYMLNRAAEEKRKTGKNEVQASLILRVDRLTPFEKTYKIMKACRLAGYQKVQLRVLRSNEG